MTADTESALNEILPFLDVLTPVDYKMQIIDHILGMTGTSDGVMAISKHVKLLDKLEDLICNDQNDKVLSECLKVLVNLTSSYLHKNLEKKLLSEDFICYMLRLVTLENAVCADLVAMLLSNISQTENNCKIILRCIQNDDMLDFNKIINTFCNENLNKHCSLHHVGSLLANLTLLKEVRLILLNDGCKLLHRFFCFTQYEKSHIRRLATAKIIKNCLFETEYHETLMSEDVDIIPSLLMPLAGPEEFTEAENDELPVDLQYLPDDKKREGSKEIVILLLEALFKLGATKVCRLKLKESGSYYILRELHKCADPDDDEVQLPLENIIQLLIGDEPEEGLENLLEVEVPDHLTKKFQNTVYSA